MSKRATHWQDIQEKTFTRWVNDYLRKRGMKIDDLCGGLADGLALCHLLEILSGKSVGKYNKHPRIAIQKLENVTMCLDFIKAQKIKLVNIGPTDICEGNKRIVLGLIWTLILFFEICQGDPDYKGAKDQLLEWVRKKIPEYHKEKPIKNFKGKTWYNGLALNALIDATLPKNKQGNRPGIDADFDWHNLDPEERLQNCNQGIESAFIYLNVDKLLEGDEMSQKKCDERAIMTYIAQFRNISEEFLKTPEDDPEPKINPADLCKAYGPGLQEAISGEETEFYVEVPMGICPTGDDGEQKEFDLEVKISGPVDVEFNKKYDGDGTYTIDYTPSEPGEYTVMVRLNGSDVPGSEFMVLVLEDECLGGEGQIRVYFSTTSSSMKSKKDRVQLERLLTTKKVHLRSDFVPWQPVDLMTPDDRNRVFKKAGTRALPIVFVDDQYVGDYDKLQELEEEGKLDDLLAMDKAETISHEEHMKRLRQTSGIDKNDLQELRGENQDKKESDLGDVKEED